MNRRYALKALLSALCLLLFLPAAHAQTPSCGISGDSTIHVPSNWSAFTPPARGQSYVDATFGCTVTRLTDVSTEEFASSCNTTGCYMPIIAGYATISPFNAGDTYLMVSDGWNEHFIIDLHGNIVVPISAMPAANDGWFLWDTSNPELFYYTDGNSLMSGTVNGSTTTTIAVHEFTEYSAVNFMDETDVSQDGAHVVIIGGDNSGTSPENIFDYNFVTNSKGPIYTTQCTGVVNNTNNSCLHKIIQTPDNNILVEFDPDGTGTEQGERLWTGALPMPHMQDYTNHLDAGYDKNGNAVFIDIGNPSVLSTDVNPCPSGWGTEVRMIYNMSSAVCLADIDKYGSLSNEHVGYRGNASQPWVGLSFFDDRSPSPEWFDTSSNYTAPTSSNWQYLEDEVDLVRIDANNNPQYLYRLAYAHSRSDVDFDAQPHAAISRDGKYVVFNSNMAFAHTGCPANFQTATGCTDVYIINVGEGASVPSSPAGLTVTSVH